MFPFLTLVAALSSNRLSLTSASCTSTYLMQWRGRGRGRGGEGRGRGGGEGEQWLAQCSQWYHTWGHSYLTQPSTEDVRETNSHCKIQHMQQT